MVDIETKDNNANQKSNWRTETDTEIIFRYAYFDGEKRAIAERHYTKKNKQ